MTSESTKQVPLLDLQSLALTSAGGANKAREKAGQVNRSVGPFSQVSVDICFD